MSVEFGPKTPEITAETPPDKLMWSGHLFLKDWAGVPKQYMQDEGFGWQDFEHEVWKMGHQPFQYWMSFAQQHQMKPYPAESWPHSKLYVHTFGPNNEIAYGIRLYGEWPDYTNKEFNIANANAYQVCKMLGIPESGCMNPHALLNAIENRNPAILYLQEPSESHEEGMAHIIDYGLTGERMQRYLLYLEELCDFCIQKEVDVCWG